MIPTKRIQQKADSLFINIQVWAYRVCNNLQELCSEDKGLDVIITVILLALGLVVVGILANYAQKIIDVADNQVDKITGNNSTTGFFGGVGSGGGFR